MKESIPLASLSEHIVCPPNLVITFASFEDRCLSASAVLIDQKFDSAIVFFIEEFISHSKDNRSNLLSYFGDKGRDISLSHSDPRGTADSIFGALTPNFSNHQNILVDISTFTRESLLILLKALNQHKQPHQKLQLIYTCAKDTSPDLSYDLVELRSVMGYMGEMKPAKPLHLIIMLGFEYERAQQVIEAYEPDYISIGYGASEESISSGLHELNIKFKEKLISIYTNHVINQFNHSLVDPFKTRNKLSKIVDSKSACNTVIAPLNNKISTVGAGLLAIKRPEVQVCYTQMGGYNTANYSSASDRCYVIDLW